MIVLAFGGPFVSALRAAEDSPRMIVKLDNERVYEGDSVLYQVKVLNADGSPQPKFDGFEGFAVELLQTSVKAPMSVTINGVPQEVGNSSITYLYRLTPQKVGVFTLPSPTVEWQDQTIAAKQLKLAVIAPEEQDSVRMEISCEQNKPYISEPIKITPSIAVKAFAEPFAKENPLAIQAAPSGIDSLFDDPFFSQMGNTPFAQLGSRQPLRALKIPWMNDKQLPEGIRAHSEIAETLNPIANRQGLGFVIDGINNSVAFLPKSKLVRLPDKSGKETLYWQCKFTRTLIPIMADEFTFGPASVKGQFPVRVESDGRTVGVDSIFARAKPITVTVKDVPSEGRPENYLGAVGKFQLSADLRPHRAKAGDPMTLVLTLRGEGTPDNAQAPDLAKIPAIAKHFKIYNASDETKNGVRRFTYNLRPLSAEAKEFPAIEAAYFDPETEKYETMRSAAIPLEITASDALSDRDIVAAASAPKKDSELKTRREGVYANVADRSGLCDQSIRPVAFATAWASLLAGYGLLALGVAHVKRRNADPARLRRNSAARNARQAMKNGLRQLSAGDARTGVESIESALLNCVADWTGVPAAGITSAEACRKLQSLATPAEVITAVARCLEQCEAFRFGGTVQAVEILEKEAESALESLIAALKKAKGGTAS
jgi:hypothetical protein